MNRTGDTPADLDLTTGEPPAKLPEDKPLARTARFNPEILHEGVRTGVALTVIAAVVAETLILTIAFVGGGIPSSALSDATAAVITPLIGIAGTVLGFYFGTRRPGG